MQKPEQCNECKIFGQHHNLYTAARKAYRTDTKKKLTTATSIHAVDMQKVLLLPKMAIKEAFFVSRLIVFNETFCPINTSPGQDTKNICVLWHEAINGRRAAEVASSYLNFILKSNRLIKDFVFWSDNCSAQNKNWTLYSALLQIVNQSWGPATITIKYFIPGHSYMKCDAVHGHIGVKWKDQEEILTLNELVNVIESAGNNYVLQLAATDFVDFVNICRKRKLNTECIPFMDNIQVVQFQKGSGSMYYKSSYKDEEVFKECNLIPLGNLSKFPKNFTEAIGINARKMEKIASSLLPSMPPMKRVFWNSLKTNEAAKDLCTEYQE